MNQAQLDPKFETYLRDDPRISYVQPDDPWLTRQFITSMEVLLGRRKIESIYRELKRHPFAVEEFFDAAFTATGIQPQFNPQQVQKIPKQGPLVFVANHPFGVVDGMALCKIALQARGNFRILIHAMLCQDRDLAAYFLPIDFRETKTALKNNIHAKRLALEYLNQDIPILIFPSGLVSTADRKGFGRVVDAPWTTFAAKLIRDANATVVPVYFHGQNSRRFHLASHVAEPLRMALLLNEVLKKFGHSVRAEIGDPLPWESLTQFDSRQSLTDYLYQKVQALAPRPTRPKSRLIKLPRR
ncbi:MAG TPA: hemolysin [Gammaproteobacteria bacterium]|nr:hemolysin [Gammaproteobacteria bacterium]